MDIKNDKMKADRREWLDYLLGDRWKVRVYILKSGDKEDFRLLIENEDVKDSIIRFDQGGGHDHFHIDILGKTPKPYQSFPHAKSLDDKIKIVFDYIRNELKYKVIYGDKTLNLSPKRLKEIESNILKELQDCLKFGTRTTSRVLGSASKVAPLKK